jgi:hypothetical protein
MVICYGSTILARVPDPPSPSESELEAFEPLRRLLVADAVAKRARAKARAQERERARRAKSVERYCESALFDD